MKLILKILTAVWLAGLLPAHAQLGSQIAVPNSPAYENAAAELRNAPPQQYDFSKALLSDTFRLMAQDAGISFFGLPEGSTGADRLVTFSIHASPFSALETLARSNGISLIFENGIWYIRPANDTELIGRIYQINYNAQELVRKNDQGGSLGGSSSSSGGGGGGASSIGLNLQGAPDYFVTEPSRLLEDIRSILDLGTTGGDALMAPLASVDTVGQLSLRGMPSNNLANIQNAAGANGGSGGEGGESPAKVIWNSDSNSLCGRHPPAAPVDRGLPRRRGPAATAGGGGGEGARNQQGPQTELGLDWTGTLAGGYGAGLTGVEDITLDEDTGLVSFTETADGRMSSLIDLDRAGDYKLPLAILSYDEVNVRLRALFEDRKTKAVSYPRMITVDNREVSFRSVINQPVLSSNASTSLGAGATETSSVEYVPIGTVINILPKRMNNGQVLLNISIVVSAIVGTEIINGNPYPIASSRVYTAPVMVESGYTIAISGLDAATHERTDTGVPFLGRIPIIGYAFKYKNDQRHNQHLMMLITPTLMDSRAPGVSNRPTIQDPWKNQPVAEVNPASFGPAGAASQQMAAAPSQAPEPAPVAAAPPAPMVADAAPRTTREAHGTAEPMPVAKPQRKRFLGGLFSRKNKQPAHENAAPVSDYDRPAEAPEAPGAGGQSFAEVTGEHEKKGWRPFAKRTKPASAPSPAALPVVTGPKPAPAPRKGIRWDGSQLAGGADAIPGAVAELQQQFEQAEKDSDTRKFSELHAQSERLLRYVDELRDNDGVPIEGKLSDEWWNLVALKTKSKNLTRSSAPVFVDAVIPEDPVE